MAASKHGSTAEIGEAIGEVLTGAGHEASVVPPEEIHDLEGYAAVVLGSAVYTGRGMKLVKSELGFGEKAIVLALRAPEGDFRDWDEIQNWARGIAEELGSKE